jgi:hypothetical protein
LFALRFSVMARSGITRCSRNPSEIPAKAAVVLRHLCLRSCLLIFQDKTSNDGTSRSMTYGACNLGTIGTCPSTSAPPCNIRDGLNKLSCKLIYTYDSHGKLQLPHLGTFLCLMLIAWGLPIYTGPWPRTARSYAIHSFWM